MCVRERGFAEKWIFLGQKQACLLPMLQMKALLAESHVSVLSVVFKFLIILWAGCMHCELHLTAKMSKVVLSRTLAHFIEMQFLLRLACAHFCCCYCCLIVCLFVFFVSRFVISCRESFAKLYPKVSAPFFLFLISFHLLLLGVFMHLDAAQASLQFHAEKEQNTHAHTPRFMCDKFMPRVEINS